MRHLKLVTASFVVVAVSAISVAAVRPALLFPQEMPKPTEQHKMLMKSVGTWEGTLTMSMPGMPTEGVAAKEVVTAFGPFWTTSHFTCDFMGMPFEGSGLMGYDPNKEKYLGTWIDNMSPALAVMEGELDEESGKLTMHYEAINMMTGEMTPHSNVMTMGENSYTLEFYMGEGDEAMHTMTIEMKRKMEKK
ncbi:MAG: DUF1579 family protein [Planctomycetes bacterium]|nr:DUF1579 family protein [Planctomycetota bacterium]